MKSGTAFRSGGSRLAVLALLLAGCAAKPPPEVALSTDLAAMRATASQVIADPARRARVQSDIDGLGHELEALEHAIAKVRNDLHELNSRGARRPEVEAALGEFDAARKSIRARIMDRHFGLIAGTTPDEWKALAPHERDALLAAAGRT